MLLGRGIKVRRWWDHVDPHLIVGARPFSRDVPRLHQHGVTAVVNTCEEIPGPVRAYEQYGIHQLRIPTTDFTHPLLADIETAVEYVQSEINAGGTVYVHCKAGRARSATIALCWLIKYRGLTPAQAQQQLLEARPHVNRHLTERPAVREFVERLAAADPTLD